MPASFRSLAALAALSLAASCYYKVETRLTTPTAVAAQLEGEWNGTWTNAPGDQTGSLRFLLRTFQGQLVLGFATDNPAAQQQTFAFAFQGAHVEVTGAEIQFLGDLDVKAKVFAGTFTGSHGAGTWQADWTRELPPIVDLSGTWIGTYRGDSQLIPEGPLTLTLVQQLVHGQLRVTGSIELQSLSLTVPVVDGAVDWNADTFDVQLISDITTLPIVQLTGVGDPLQRRIDQGEFVVLPPPGLPVGLGSWQAVWVAP